MDSVLPPNPILSSLAYNASLHTLSYAYWECFSFVSVGLGKVGTLDTSKKAAEYGQFLDLAFLMRVESRNTASTVLLFFRKPNWWGPISPWASVMSVIRVHILTVRRRSRFEGIVIGLYCPGERESPPCNINGLILSSMGWCPYLMNQHAFTQVETFRDSSFFNDLVQE